MDELIIENKFIRVEKFSEEVEQGKKLRIYKYSPDQIMIQIRAFTSITRKSKPAAYIASYPASAGDLDKIIAELQNIRAQLKGETK